MNDIITKNNSENSNETMNNEAVKSTTEKATSTYEKMYELCATLNSLKTKTVLFKPQDADSLENDDDKEITCSIIRVRSDKYAPTQNQLRYLKSLDNVIISASNTCMYKASKVAVSKIIDAAVKNPDITFIVYEVGSIRWASIKAKGLVIA